MKAVGEFHPLSLLFSMRDGKVQKISDLLSYPKISKIFDRIRIFQKGGHSRSNAQTTKVSNFNLSFTSTCLFAVRASCAVVYELAVRHFFPLVPKGFI